MLAALLLNAGIAKPGADEDRRYYELLRARRLRDAQRAKAKADADRRDAATQLEVAERAFAVVLAAVPETAHQIVQPHVARPAPESSRFVVDWDSLISDLVAFECLCRVMADLEDEEALILAIAVDN